MRGAFGVGFVAIAILVSSAPAAAPHVGGSRLDPVIWVTACSVGFTGDCRIDLGTHSASIIFFRYDLDADGDWDFPDQTGGGGFGKWATFTTVWRTYSEPMRGVCAEGWDGISTRTIGGQLFPKAPRGCSTFADFLPERWDRNSPGRALWVRLQVPSWMDPRDISPRGAEVEGVRAFLWPPNDRSGERDPGEFLFRVDRLALTRLLGPGTHIAHLALPWSGTSFTAAGTVTIT